MKIYRIGHLVKTNPIQTQSKPILKRMNVNFCATGCACQAGVGPLKNSVIPIIALWKENIQVCVSEQKPLYYRCQPSRYPMWRSSLAASLFLNFRFSASHRSFWSFTRIAIMPRSTISVNAPPYSKFELAGLPSLHARNQSPSWLLLTLGIVFSGLLYARIFVSGTIRNPPAPCEPCSIHP